MPIIVVSLIVPVGPHEKNFPPFLADPSFLEDTSIELILVCPTTTIEKWQKRAHPRICIVGSEKSGRAFQLNIGAAKAQSEYFWFVHADSELTRNHLEKAKEAANQKREGIGYFDLDFTGSKLPMALNKWGAFFRSRCLKMPFGDQALLCSKALFEKLKGFPTNVPYGEDHCFVWQARIQGAPLYSFGIFLKTSARKYEQKGWGKTTLQHLYLTYKQAAPFAAQLLKKRINS